MISMQKILNNVKVLEGWDGCNVEPRIEENPEEIWMLIKYSNHGDEYLVVGTRDGMIYEYGCYVNLKGYDWMTFVRKPVLYRKLDDRAVVSNTIFFELERVFKDSHMSFGYDKKYYDEKRAQWTFDHEMSNMMKMSSESEVFFDFEYCKEDILGWLILNNIATDENIKKLNKTTFHNKIGKNKVIGVSGKMDISKYKDLIVDDVEFIYINGKSVDPRKICAVYSTDEWGYDLRRLCLKGFRPSKVRA